VQTVLLEETGQNTGVFAATVATRPHVGARSGETLQVFEGETLTAEYLDQLRAYGERNVLLKETLPVGAIGAKLVER
jgi:hypothetical protein